MPICLTLSAGRLLPCKGGIGGIKAVSFAVWDSANLVQSVDGEVDALPITMTAAYRYELKNAGNLYTETINADPETRNILYDGALALVLQKLDLITRNEIKMLVKGEVNIFVETNNGDVLLIGSGFGAQCNGGTIVTGGAKTDLTGYNLTFQTQETEPYLTLSSLGLVEYAGIVVEGT
jgi:hypothetical protein